MIIIFLEFKNTREIWKDGNSWKMNKVDKLAISKLKRTSTKSEMQIKEELLIIFWIWIMTPQTKENS